LKHKQYKETSNLSYDHVSVLLAAVKDTDQPDEATVIIAGTVIPVVLICIIAAGAFIIIKRRRTLASSK